MCVFQMATLHLIGGGIPVQELAQAEPMATDTGQIDSSLLVTCTHSRGQGDTTRSEGPQEDFP